MINLELYRTFKVIYQSGTLTKASGLLLLTQPALSQQLASLENYIGETLFIRTPRKLIPTDRAKEIYSKIIEPLELLERTEKHFKKSELKKENYLKLGSPMEFFTCFSKEISNNFPEQFSVEFGLAINLLEKLKNKSLDLVISTIKPNSQDFDSRMIYEEKFILVGNKKSNLKEIIFAIKKNKWNDVEKYLLTHNWILYDNNFSIIKRFWKNNFDSRPKINNKIILPNLISILKFLENYEGFSILPDYLFNKTLKIKSIEPVWEGKTPTTNSIYSCFRIGEIKSHIEFLKY